MAEQVDIKTRLLLQADAAKKTIGELRKEFAALSESRETVQKGMGFLGQTLSTMAGVYLPQAARGVRDFGMSFVEAATKSTETDQALAGMITTIQDLPWDASMKQAEAWGDRIDAIALSTQQATDDVRAAFKALATAGGSTSGALEQSASDLTKLATVANVLGLQTSEIANQWAFAKQGMIEARSPLVQLLKTSGIFGDNLQQATAAWQQMKGDDRAKALAFGLDQISAKLTKAEPIYSDITTEIQNTFQAAKEIIGAPLMNAIVPHIRRLSMWLQENRGELEAWVKTMATDVGKWVNLAAEKIQYGWRVIMSHQDEIKSAIIEAWTFAKSVIDFAIAHKDAIAMAVGAKMIASGPVGSAIGGVGSMAKGAFNVGKAGTTVGGIGMAGAAGGAVALGAFAAAIGGVALAAWQGEKLMRQIDDDEKADVRARYEYFRRMGEESKNDFAAWDQVAQQHFQKTRVAFEEEASLIGLSKVQAKEMADAMLVQHNANRAMVEDAEQASESIIALSKANDGFMDVAQTDALVGRITAQYQAAVDAGNTGAQEYIASLLAKSKDLQTAFLDSADMTSGAFATLAELTKEKAGDFSAAIGRLGDAAAKSERATSAVPKINLNGGQTFKIQQDFRDQDPDRVAIVFRRDIAASAVARVQSSYASPFGS